MQNEDYIKGLLQNNDKVLRAIYKNFADRVSNYVLKNGGSREDAKDVFQDALLIIYEKAQSPNFKLSSSFYTYLFSVNKLVWHNKSRKKSRNNVVLPDNNTLKDSQNIEQQLLDRELDTIYQDNFKTLSAICQKLLQLFFAKKNMTEIAQQLGLPNEHTARTRKYRCRQALKKKMEADNRFQELHTFL